MLHEKKQKRTIYISFKILFGSWNLINYLLTSKKKLHKELFLYQTTFQVTYICYFLRKEDTLQRGAIVNNWLTNQANKNFAELSTGNCFLSAGWKYE